MDYETCVSYKETPCIMLLEKDLSTLSMGIRLKLPPFINPKFGQIGRPCPDVSRKV